jgi:hypothetical protein
MAKILKPYEVPLEDDLAGEILNIPLTVADDAPEPKTIGERVAAATRAVYEANEYLAKSPLAALVAETLMRKLKKRGVPSIMVQPDGTVILHISYDEVERPRMAPPPVARATRNSTLPKLDDLRKEAKRHGIDISDLGQKRRAIHERLLESKAPTSSQEDPKPPDRLVDEATESDPPPAPKTVLRRRAAGASEELDVDDLLQT